MKKSNTIIRKACVSIPGFSRIYQKMQRSTSLVSKSQTTLTN